MDELAHQLNFVLSYFGLESVISLGVGAGGNILARFAYLQPEKVRFGFLKVFTLEMNDDFFFIVSHVILRIGGSFNFDKRRIDTGRLDRMGLSKIKY